MKSHDFARLLLTQPDLELTIVGDEGVPDLLPTGGFTLFTWDGVDHLLVETVIAEDEDDEEDESE